MTLTEEQRTHMDTLAEQVDLKALAYDFSPDDARKWATAMGESYETWARRWANALKTRAAEIGLHCPWSAGVISRAIQKEMEE